jgi:hypothetical protein
MADPKGALDYSVPKEQMINTAGLPEDEQQNIMDARSRSLDALEQRYAQPNWFKVSAGFLKPQLGGFGASLGSAFDAMGENVEQQRAIAPTIAVERAKLEQMKAMMGKSERAANMVANLVGLGPNAGRKLGGGLENLPDFITPENQKKLAGAVVTLKAMGEGDKAEAIKAALDAQQTKTVTQGTEAETEMMRQRFETESPFYKLQPGATPEDWRKNAEVTRKKLTANLVASGMYTPEGLKNISDQDLLDKSQELQKANASMKIKNAQSAGEVIRGNSDALQDLITARDISSSSKLEKMLGIGAGQDAISALFGWVSAPTEAGKIGKLNEAAAKLAQADPQAYADFQVLQKVLQKNLADARSTIQNPSVGAQNLLSGTQPTVLNSRLAIVKMLDLIAHEKSTQIREGVLRQNYRGPNPAGFETDPVSGYANLQKNITQERRKIEQSPTMGSGLPNFYNPYEALYSSNNTTSEPNAQPSVTTPANSKGLPTTHSPKHKPANTGRTTSLDAIEEAMKKKGMQIPQ